MKIISTLALVCLLFASVHAQTPMYDTSMRNAVTVAAQTGMTQKVVELTTMPPRTGAHPCIVRTDYGFDVPNRSNRNEVIVGSFGVSQPSEAQYPMRPFVGYTHPMSRVVVAPGTSQHVHLARWDIINSAVIPTPMPWKLVGNPHLTGEIENDSGFSVSIENIYFVSTVQVLP